MTQPTINDLTIKRVDRMMEDAVYLDGAYIGSLLYDWRTDNITAWPAKGHRRTFHPKHKQQAQQYLIKQHLKNKKD